MGWMLAGWEGAVNWATSICWLSLSKPALREVGTCPGSWLRQAQPADRGEGQHQGAMNCAPTDSTPSVPGGFCRGAIHRAPAAPPREYRPPQPRLYNFAPMESLSTDL